MILLTLQLAAQAKNNYELQSNKQKNSVWILLGRGTSLGLISNYRLIHGFTNLAYGQNIKKNGSGLACGLIGLATALGSIALFITSSKNKRLAMRMTVSLKQMSVLVKSITGSAFIPPLALKLCL